MNKMPTRKGNLMTMLKTNFRVQITTIRTRMLFLANMRYQEEHKTQMLGTINLPKCTPSSPFRTKLATRQSKTRTTKTRPNHNTVEINNISTRYNQKRETKE